MTPRPKCRHCGENPIQFLNRKISEYCSKECSNRDNKNLGVGWGDKEEGLRKRKETVMKRYGVEHHTQTEEWKRATSERMSTQIPESSLQFLNSKDWLFEQYVEKSRSVYDIAEELNVHYGTVFERIDKFQIPRQYQVSSIGQREVAAFIESLNIPVRIDVIGKLHGKHHLDIYCEEHNFGIEYNGLFYHSAGSKDEIPDKRVYHLNKTIAAEDNGITLIHITDEQWKTKRSIVESIIRNKLGLSERIMARKTKIIRVDSKTARMFFQENHIQGFVGGREYIALSLEDEIVCMMSFGDSRFNKNCDFELLRFANKLNCVVVGGFSRLLKEFRKTHHGASIVSYADRSRSSGSVYEKNGFELVHVSSPGYGYTDGQRLFNRQEFQKHKLKEKLNFFDETLTEEENMFANKYRKYFDCGQITYILK